MKSCGVNNMNIWAIYCDNLSRVAISEKIFIESRSMMGFDRVKPGRDRGTDLSIGSIDRSILFHLRSTITSILDRSSQKADRFGSGMNSFRSVDCFDAFGIDRVTRCHRESVNYIEI